MLRKTINTLSQLLQEAPLKGCIIKKGQPLRPPLLPVKCECRLAGRSGPPREPNRDNTLVQFCSCFIHPQWRKSCHQFRSVVMFLCVLLYFPSEVRPRLVAASRGLVFSGFVVNAYLLCLLDRNGFATPLAQLAVEDRTASDFVIRETFAGPGYPHLAFFKFLSLHCVTSFSFIPCVSGISIDSYTFRDMKRFLA